MDTSQGAQPSPQTTGSKEWPWTPRFWDGMAMWGMVPAGGPQPFCDSPRAMAVLITLLSVMNSAPGSCNGSFFSGGKIARTEIQDDPIFVIGHWRSGTTLLHELLGAGRQRHTYSDTYACFTPQAFSGLRLVLAAAVGCCCPRRRPMDNMAAGWDRPQEDEFALCNMGARRPT